MTSPSPVSSTAVSQTVCPEEVTNQTLMNAIADLRAQLTSVSRRQDELMELITDLRYELDTRAGPLFAPSAAAQSSLGPASIVPQTSSLVPVPVRRIGREPALYHPSTEEEVPWKAPGCYHPYWDSTPPTRGKPIVERLAYPSSLSLHPPVSCQRVSDSYGEANQLPPLYSPPLFRLPAQQGSQSSPLPTPPRPTLPPIEAILNLPPLTTHEPLPISRARLLRRGPVFHHVSPTIGTPFVASGPDIFRPPPYPPMTAPTAPATHLPSPKRKRGDAGDEIDDEEASDKKRPRHPSADDIDWVR